MTVRLPREPLLTGVRVVEITEWIGPDPRSHGTYWHMPRSASLRQDGTLTIQTWCGPLFHGVTRARLSDMPPEDLKCGTCVGRKQGYDRQDGMVFTPRDYFAAPRWCPCDESDPATNHRTCMACSKKVNAARGFWATGMASHPPAPELLDRYEPCPQHGWGSVVWRDGTLRCTLWVGGDKQKCGYDCRRTRQPNE